jgi:hypothetical protein
MKTYGLILAATVLLLPLDPAAVPQQNTPPASNQPNSAPSLAVTMTFLQSTMDDIGKVNFVEFWHDTKAGNDGTNTYTEEVTNAAADPNRCQIAYHWKVTRDGATWVNADMAFSLRDVQDAVVEQYEQFENVANAAEGTPNMVVSSTNPPLTVLVVRRPHAGVIVFPFIDRTLADRYAKAMVHAVGLCGGGNKDPF